MKVRFRTVRTTIQHARRRRHPLGWILLMVAMTGACNGSGNDAIEPAAGDTTTTTRQNATTTVPPITTTVAITTTPTATTSSTTTVPSTTTSATTTTLAPTTTVASTTTTTTTTVANTTTTAPSNSLQITIANFAFSGASTGSVGDTVTVRNNDSVAHTWTAVGGAFHSGNLGGGGTFTYTFESAGTFEYLCQIHPSMTGSITISG